MKTAATEHGTSEQTTARSFLPDFFKPTEIPAALNPLGEEIDPFIFFMDKQRACSSHLSHQIHTLDSCFEPPALLLLLLDYQLPTLQLQY